MIFGKLRPYLGSLSLAIGALIVAVLVNLFIQVEGLGRIFLVAILISAISFGLWPSIFASLICAAIYDLFFLPPIYSLSISSGQDIVDLVCFLFIAIITSALAPGPTLRRNRRRTGDDGGKTGRFLLPPGRGGDDRKCPASCRGDRSSTMSGRRFASWFRNRERGA